MSQPIRSALLSHLQALCEDCIFIIASTRRFDVELLREAAKRRCSSYQTPQKRPVLGSVEWAEWVHGMCVTLAPLSPPTWLPMSELIQALTLESGARGVRSLFTSKPSDKQVQSTRATGSLTVRIVDSMLGADGTLGPEDKLLRSCLIASFGLPEDDVRVLESQPVASADGILLPVDLDQKTRHRLAKGLWQTAFRDGLDPREDSVALSLCQRLMGAVDEVEALRREVRAEIDTRKLLGSAAVDAVRYVLADHPDNSSRLARMTAHLALPPVHRSESLAAIEHSGPIVLARRHELERTEREACLAIAWFAAISTDPSRTMATELALRHDRIASDLGSRSESAAARASADSFVYEQLYSAAQAAGL